MNDELLDIASQMADLLPLFQNGGALHGRFLPSEHSATFKALAIEAKSILDIELGPLNDYSMNLFSSINAGASGLSGKPSYAAVEEASKIVRSAARAVQRKPAQLKFSTSVAKTYVDLSRIDALQRLPHVKWDFSRLSELCRELNVAHANKCSMSTAMLLRTILDHVPPVLGFDNFSKVANNYGGKSFKRTMLRLQGSLRNIADMHLHSPIRSREDIPTPVQVDFAADLDVLLGEIIRVAGLEAK